MISFHFKRHVTVPNERGVALIYYALLLFVIIFFGYVAIRFGKVNRDRVAFQSHIHSALNAGIMAAPGAQDIFLASCNHLKALWLPSLPCAAADLTPWPPLSPTTPSIATYTGAYSSAGGEYSCSSIQMTYTPANPPSVTQPRFCIDVSCADQSLILGSSNIRNIGASNCIGAPPVAAYLAVDYSTSLSDTYSDWSPDFYHGGTPRTISMTPPSFAVLGNDNYFGTSSIPPQAAPYNPGTPTEVTAKIVDMQLPGIRQYLDAAGNLTQPVRMPFFWGEINLKSQHSIQELLTDDLTSFRTNYSRLNPDGLSPNVWLSLPDIAIPNSGPDLVPDPIQYISDNPKIAADSNYLTMESTMRDWISGGSCNLDDTAGCGTLHSFTRGGHITQNYLANQCYNGFMTIYKQAAEQVLYLFGKYKIRAGVLGFSNWIYPILPLFPEVFFNTVGSPLYNLSVSSNNVKVLGPAPGTLIPSGIVPNNDFVLSQFGDNSKSGGYRLNRNRASQVLNAMSYCYRDMAFEVIEGGTKYFTALPNIDDPAMLVKPNTEPDEVRNCAGDQASYVNPMAYGANGACYLNLPGAPSYPNHFDHGGRVCSYQDIPVEASGLHEPPWAFPNYGGSSPITNSQILYPWRWCNDNNSRPNVAIGIHSIAAGQFSKIGLEHEGQSQEFDESGPLGDPEYPFNTFGPSTTFTSGGALIAIRALLDPVLAPPGTRKILVLFTDGVPTVSLHNLISNPTGTQSYWFPRNPTQDEVPQYGTGTPTLSGMLETAHLLQYAASQGITVYLQMVASGSEGPYKNALLAMLREPNVVTDPDTNGYAYNFCKTPEAQSLALSLTGNPNQLPGEAAYPASSPQNCDPSSSQYSDGINVLDVTKTATETYDQFRQRVFSQLGSQLLYEIKQWQHTK